MRRGIKRLRTFSKGKARAPFECGAKAGLAVTLRGNLIVGAQAFSGARYDGHTLIEQFERASILMQGSTGKPTKAFVYQGYRGVDADDPRLTITLRGKAKSLSPEERKLLKRRNAIEPNFGQLKSDCRIDRCHLKGEMGDRLHLVLCAAGYNLRWLLRIIAKNGLRAVLCLLPAQVKFSLERALKALAEPRVPRISCALAGGALI